MRNADTTVNSPFCAVYSLARLNRGNIHFRGQFFRFAGGGDIFVDDTGALHIGRSGVYTAYTPGVLAGEIGRGFGRDMRMYLLERARDAGRVPLP